MKKILFAFICFVLIGTYFSRVFGYGNVNTHPAINKVIVDEFEKRLSTYKTSYTEFKKFSNYYFSFDIRTYKGLDVTSAGQEYIYTGITSKTCSGWIQRGGYTADEPEIPAALRHFYDPEMNEGYLYLTDLGWYPLGNPKIEAVFWAFEGTDPSGNNEWTWNQGKENMELAIRTADQEEKDGFTAKAMRCLGEVLHNTADMGLPAHVRNDAHGGYGPIGGRLDPYEFLTSSNPDWAEDYGVKKCDPDLANYFRSSSNAKYINIYLAKYTNKNFFSQETISGEGVDNYNSYNGFKNYTSPKLENFRYDPLTFGYYKSFPSGREVKMCVDQSLFMGYISGNFRSQPRIDTSCVRSQAAELLPNIVEAGINVIRNFIPYLKVNLSVNSKTGEVSGDIKHITDSEYPNSISYAGDVKLLVNGKKTTIMTATDGKFSGKVSGLKNGDKVVAEIEFADIIVDSDESKINLNALTLLNMGDFTVRAELVWNNNSKFAGYDRDQFSDWKFTSANSTITETNLSINKTTYCAPHTVEVFTVSFNPSTQKVESFQIKATNYSGDRQFKVNYDISLKNPAVAAKWFQAGGCELMSLSLTDIQNNVNYTETRYSLKPLNDGSGNSDWAVDQVLNASCLKANDGLGHITSIKFNTSTTK